jgi:similar to stage IV sporulation protein
MKGAKTGRRFGTCQIVITGLKLERFFYICRANDVVLRHIYLQEDSLVCSIYRRDYEKIIKITEKTKGTVIKVTNQGLFRILDYMGKRKSFFIGALLAALFAVFMSGFIWKISATGMESYSEREIIDYIHQLNIYTGMLKSDINCDEIETAIRNQFDHIIWVSAELSGTHLIIHVKETLEKEELEAESRPGHLIAKVDGVITSIVTRKGTPLVKQGDSVKQGDVLVSGIVPVYDDNGEVADNLLVAADADVMAQLRYDFSYTVDASHTVKVYSGLERKHYFIRVGDGKVIFKTGADTFKNSDMKTYESEIQFFRDFYFPIFYGSMVIREYITKTLSYTKEEQEALCMEKYEEFLENFTKKGIQIIEKDDTISMIGAKCHIEGYAIVNESIIKVEPLSEEEMFKLQTERNENDYE